MKKVIILFFIFSMSLLADWGFFSANRSWIGIDFNGSVTWYTVYNNGVGTFESANLGTFTSSEQTLKIDGWDVKTYKNSGSDVTGANMFYRIYKQSTTPGSFSNTGGGFLEDLGDGNQRWGISSSTNIAISGLEAGQTYVLEIYIEAYGLIPNETKYDNNGSSNFKATFSTEEAFPVQLSSFSANIINKSVNLKWQTATEQNNYGFEIERSQKLVVSSENTTWETIGFVNGSGNSNSPKEYSYTDNSINNSGNYSYRLKQVDNNGSYEYSSVVEVDYNPVITFELEQNYPNPFNPATVINYTLAEPGFVTIKVYNMLGEEVTTLINGQMEAGKHSVEFSTTSGVSSLTSGLYLYKIQAGSFTQVKKMILTK